MPSTRDPRLVIEQLRQLVEAWEVEERITLGTLCALLAIRPRTLHHYCVGQGISPLQLVLRIRLDRVRHALLTGEGNVTSMPVRTVSRHSAASPASIAARLVKVRETRCGRGALRPILRTLNTSRRGLPLQPDPRRRQSYSEPIVARKSVQRVLHQRPKGAKARGRNMHCPAMPALRGHASPEFGLRIPMMPPGPTEVEASTCSNLMPSIVPR
jgi:AraC-like DNA-binding protein